MPLYMDIHIVPGVKSKDVAEAHRKDLLHQQDFGCTCMTYWIDEERETIFCLIDAPDKDAVKEMHRKAHGLVPNRVVEVSSSIVKSFLGRIYDPEDAVINESGLKIFSDPSFRLLLVSKMNDHVLLKHQLGNEKANNLLKNHNEIVRKNILIHGGNEVEHAGEGFIVSFDSVSKAVACGIAINEDTPHAEAGKLGFKMAINGGEPIEKSKELFGDTVKFAQNLCSIAATSQIALAVIAKDLVSKELLQNKKNHFLTLSLPDEEFFQQLYTKLEKKFNEPGFDIPEYSQSMAMSQTQLYRKTTSLTGVSCNVLLKNFRLEKAKELLKKQRNSISQVTFETGFTSPSYFTKCFKKKFGLLPMEYLELLKTS